MCDGQIEFAAKYFVENRILDEDLIKLEEAYISDPTVGDQFGGDLPDEGNRTFASTDIDSREAQFEFFQDVLFVNGEGSAFLLISDKVEGCVDAERREAEGNKLALLTSGHVVKPTDETPCLVPESPSRVSADLTLAVVIQFGPQDTEKKTRVVNGFELSAVTSDFGIGRGRLKDVVVESGKGLRFLIT